MDIKLKALGPGVITALAAGATGGINASAESQATGHFTCEVSPCTIRVSEALGTSHRLELSIAGLTGIVCDEASYKGPVATTVTDITLTPTYAECHTTGSTTNVPIDVNGCTYTVTQPNKESAKTEHTVDLVCPSGKNLVVTHPECEIVIPPITGLKGFGYTTIIDNNKHAITLTSSVEGLPAEFQKGICTLLGTFHVGKLIGSATVRGFDQLGHQVGITATGSIN
ncbi:MAG TPA: hypothetical protein VKC63_11350 [Solirubrobacterales bacterium]|nr:hypothetical protein [Solirubrobacterales bacterium]